MNPDVFLVFSLGFFIFVIHYVTKDQNKDRSNIWHQRVTEKLMFDKELAPDGSRRNKGRHRT